MKTNKKALLTVLCALLLVVASVMGTMAYLTAEDSVTNTFTVGNVTMTMDEANVDGNGKEIAEGQEGAGRGDANSYKLYPGATYDKDPTLHITAESDDSWLIVAVKNPLAAFEANVEGKDTVAEQMVTHNWVAVEGAVNVPAGFTLYAQKFTQTNPAAAKDVKVFEKVYIADNANTIDADNNAETNDWTALNNAQIIVNAYAVQAEGFTTAAAAWNATFGA